MIAASIRPTLRASAIVFVLGAGGMLPAPASAASCCGGGSGSALVLPKFSNSMVDVGLDFEMYDGFWNKHGDYLKDPAGSDLRQYRLNLGVAKRIAPRWQTGLVVPYVFNDNRYTGTSMRSQGLGDASVNVWYETFDGIRCVSKVRTLSDLAPALYLGSALTLPTGISPYDERANSLEITGRGFYRLDGNILVEKTVYPLTASIAFGYGTFLERPVNREYGHYVEPYRMKLGDRMTGSASVGYTRSLVTHHSVTIMVSYSYLREAEGRLDDARDPNTGLMRKGFASSFAVSGPERSWTFRSGWGHGMRQDGWGENFPSTDIFSLGVSRAFL